jgi:hypothetical protein
MRYVPAARRRAAFRQFAAMSRQSSHDLPKSISDWDNWVR